jgi:hypothetical protein
LTAVKPGRRVRGFNAWMKPGASQDPNLPDGHHCPDCGGRLARVHRHALDRFASLIRSVHRYRCPDPACGWQGVLGRDVANAAPATSWRAPLVWFLVGVGCALVAVQAARVHQRSQAEAARASSAPQRGVDALARAAPAGTDFPGEALPATDPRVVSNPSPLRLRHGCAWGVPGGNPYRGTVAQALAAARLPPEVVAQITEMAARGWVYDQVEISRAGIRTVNGSREFGNEIRAMAFGDTLCFNTRVNFAPGHVEYADLYQATDSRGKTYTVMVPYVCQNASVLGEREEIVTNGNGVPAPATGTLALLALGLLAGQRWQARRDRQA